MEAFAIMKNDEYDDPQVMFVVIGTEADATAKCRQLNAELDERAHSWIGPLEYSIAIKP
jgi:hypothetical protein